MTYPAKLLLSPEKVMAVRARYNERIRKNCTDSIEFSKRFSDGYFNKQLNVTLSNHGRKRKANWDAGGYWLDRAWYSKIKLNKHEQSTYLSIVPIPKYKLNYILSKKQDLFTMNIFSRF